MVHDVHARNSTKVSSKMAGCPPENVDCGNYTCVPPTMCLGLSWLLASIEIAGRSREDCAGSTQFCQNAQDVSTCPGSSLRG